MQFKTLFLGQIIFMIYQCDMTKLMNYAFFLTYSQQDSLTQVLGNWRKKYLYSNGNLDPLFLDVVRWLGGGMYCPASCSSSSTLTTSWRSRGPQPTSESQFSSGPWPLSFFLFSLEQCHLWSEKNLSNFCPQEKL